MNVWNMHMNRPDEYMEIYGKPLWKCTYPVSERSLQALGSLAKYAVCPNLTFHL